MSQKKGHFNLRGVPELWDEVKKGVKIMITPTAIDKLDSLAKKHGLSRSEFIEQIARGIIPVGEPMGEKARCDRRVPGLKLRTRQQ